MKPASEKPRRLESGEKKRQKFAALARFGWHGSCPELGMIDKIATDISPSKVVTIAFSQVVAGIHLLIVIGLLTLLYSFLWRAVVNWETVLFFILLPFVFISQGVRLLEVFLGLRYSFDPSTRTINRNTEKIASFDDVEAIQVWTIDTEASYLYRLTLILRDDKKIRLAQTTDEDQVLIAAEKISYLLGVTVRKK